MKSDEKNPLGGRPFKDDVKNKNGKEGNHSEKKQVFRKLKKFYNKGKYESAFNKAIYLEFIGGKIRFDP